MTADCHAINFRYNGDPFQRVIYTESHDEVVNGKARVPEEIAPGNAADYFARKRAVLGAAITFTTPGIPMIFQGQEFLESGWFDDHVPLDWNKADTNSGLWQLYRQLIDLRRNGAGFTAGLMGPHVNVFHVDDRAKLIAYHRWQEGGAGDDVIIIANFANRLHQGYSLGFPHEGLWHVRLNSDAQQFDELFSNHPCPDVIAARFENNHNPIDGMPCWGNVTVAPYSFLILSQG
jgi:1,4-alpha-glucan branching enzyme